ncbi:MAG: hypothetical protein EXR72_08845 [Myxococcales bacterium]|nr:hypothetical protein [Myxococcales bacterium]
MAAPHIGIALLLALAASAAAADGIPALPGPGSRPRAPLVRGLGKVTSSASCVGCHQEIAAEWRSSLHRRAWIDPVFQQAYRVEPMAFCRGCHAPESDPAAPPTSTARHEGVGCTTCHVQADHVVGARPASADALHPVLADPRLATPAACASCHQFDFPAEAHQRVVESMQDTVAEHARSSAAATPCQKCHMPEVATAAGRHRSHAFAVISDPTMIRRAVHVTALRIDASRIAVTLTPAEVGHAFPTGDMFRRLEVRAELLRGLGTVAAPDRRRAPSVELARSFRDLPRDPNGGDLTPERVQAKDTRVPPPGTGPAPTVVLTLPVPAPETAVRWRVVYQRMSTPMAGAFRVNQVLDEIVVAEGILPALATAMADKGEQRW